MTKTLQETNGLEIRLFGPLSVCAGGQPIASPRTRKGLWLLALLALRHGRDVDRGWLAGTLWPDSPEDQARYNLRRSLADLRRVLDRESASIAAPTPHTLRLVIAPEAVDVLQFDACIARGDAASLETAVALYAGPLLEDCSEEWVLLERTAREQAYLHALETLAGQAVAAGDAPVAVRRLRLVLAADPMRESACQALMQALAATRDYAAVSEAYRDLRLHLRREINAEPEAETRALFDRLRGEGRQRAAAAPEREAAPPRAFPVVLQGHLPRPLSDFIGREREVQETMRSLATARLVTLTGFGGVGKTRLALHAAEQIAAAFPDGVFFADLAPLSDPALVPQTVAHALKAPERGGRDPTETLAEHLQARRLLLILDNCEHVLQASAELADALLRNCPDLHILATSRQSLGITGETERRVPPLGLPGRERLTMKEGGAASHLLEYEAVRLFVDRARRVRPDLLLDDPAVCAIAEVCVCLDGIPLAIELAAARTSVLGFDQIAARLSDRFRLLTGGSRTALPRQQTLRASIDWSWSLLKEREQALLALLSVFAGGFTLEAAEAVCAPALLAPEGAGAVSEPDTILDLLGALIASSLVLYPHFDGPNRYRLPETIRQYAEEKRAAFGAEATIRHRHADHYLAVAETARPHLRGGPAMTDWLDLLEREHDNLRRALEWYERAPDAASAENGLRLATSLQPFWMTRGHYTEGRRCLTLLLRRTEFLPPTPLHAGTLCGLGQLAAHQGDREAAHALHQQALRIYRDHGDPRGIGETLNELGNVARQREQYDAAEAYFLEALAVAQRQELSFLAALVLYNLGTIYYRTGRHAEARVRYEQALHAFDGQSNRHQRVLPLLGLAHIARKAGQWEEASRRTLETLRGCQEIGDVYYLIFALELAALVAGDRGEALRAARLAGAASGLREQLHSRPTRAQQEEQDALARRLQDVLGGEEYASASAEGRTGTAPQAIHWAIAGDAPGAD